MCPAAGIRSPPSGVAKFAGLDGVVLLATDKVVGPPGKRHAPHRSRRAELPHRAPASGDDTKPLFRIGEGAQGQWAVGDRQEWRFDQGLLRWVLRWTPFFGRGSAELSDGGGDLGLGLRPWVSGREACSPTSRWTRFRQPEPRRDQRSGAGSKPGLPLCEEAGPARGLPPGSNASCCELLV